jgi:hypothetical protein
MNGASTRVLAGIAVGGFAGLCLGLFAQLLRESSNLQVTQLGGATAIWVTLGFLVVRTVAPHLPRTHRWVWTCIVMAAYLSIWLVAYYWLFGAHWNIGFDEIWQAKWQWAAFVPPASLFLGLAVVRSLRLDGPGRACLTLPLLWSLTDLRDAASGSFELAAVLGVPTLVAALVALVLAVRPQVRREQARGDEAPA